VLAEERGLRIVSGRTESHVFLVDLRAKNITGKEAEAALGAAHITVNKNAIPNDPQKPFVTSGIRIGSPAMTTRGFTEIESEQVAHLIADVLDAPATKRCWRECAPMFRRCAGNSRSMVARRMKCPFCGADETTVADTRINDDGDIVRRRRRCLKCDKRFTTYERAELRLPQVIKKNGSRVDFDREKLAASLWLALRKRPVSVEAVEAAIARIEEKLLALGERELASEKIGEMVMRELKKLDKVAYVRFASVYRNFEDVDEFSKVIREVSRSPQPLGR
jgi:transcriptional repressor NrdR